MDVFLREVVGPGPAPGHSGVVLSILIKLPLSFVLYIALKPDRPHAVLLVNSAVRSTTHPYAGHAVIEVASHAGDHCGSRQRMSRRYDHGELVGRSSRLEGTQVRVH